MKKSILAIALVFTCCVHAQEFKFGKVSKEELLEDKYVNDSSASAAYLYKKRTSYYQYSKGAGTKLITEIHKRIKVYNTEGFDYASETIDLYKGSSSEEKVSG
ncbi:MAG: transglutaminase, partial [Allomuricauda sp.]